MAKNVLQSQTTLSTIKQNRYGSGNYLRQRGRWKTLLAQYFSQKDKILVDFGYLANDHGRNCLILVIFSHFGVAIVGHYYLPWVAPISLSHVLLPLDMC